jgi:hypothetical protein
MFVYVGQLLCSQLEKDWIVAQQIVLTKKDALVREVIAKVWRDSESDFWMIQGDTKLLDKIVTLIAQISVLFGVADGKAANGTSLWAVPACKELLVVIFNVLQQYPKESSLSEARIAVVGCGITFYEIIKQISQTPATVQIINQNPRPFDQRIESLQVRSIESVLNSVILG